MTLPKPALAKRIFEWFVANPLRLVLVLELYVAAPVLLVGEVSSQLAQEGLRREHIDEVSRVAVLTASAIEGRLTGLRTRLGAGSGASSLAELADRGDRAALARLLREQRLLVGDVVRLAVLDRDGATLAADPSPVPAVTSAAWSAILAASAGGRPIGVSEAFVDGDASVVALLAPLRPPAPAPALLAEVDLRALGAALLPQLAIAGDGDVYVLDGRGRLLARAAAPAAVPSADLSADPIVAAARTRPVSGEGADPLGGGRRFLASAPVPGLGWQVMALQATAGVDRTQREQVDQLAASRVALIVLVLLGAFAIAHNIGQLLRERRAVVEANVQLEEANRAKSHFLASVSHELRTPMNAILGFTEALLNGVDGPLNDDQRQSLTWVQRGGRDLLELVNDILDLSKIEAGGIVLSTEVFDPAEVVALVVGQQRSLAENKGLKFGWRDEGHLDEVVLDRQRTRQIVVNLVGNALKFTSAGSVEVVLGGREAGRLEITVRDTGPGIPPDHQERIFEAFQQVETTRPAGMGGTGLGLAISRQLARMMLGDVTVDSAPGRGSTFRLTLPADCRRAAARPAEALPAGRGERVLMAVDDDPSIGDLVQKMLANTGWRVAAVTDPASAVPEARRLLPDAITLDMLMPGRDGLQVLHELRADPMTEAIPVILVSVLDAGAAVEGAQGHLGKPLQRQALLDELAAVVGRGPDQR